MAYNHVDKKSGQLIKSDDWNAMSLEVVRLESAKVQRTGDTIEGDLKVTGSLELHQGKPVKEFSTDNKLGGNSDLAVPTEKAVKSYVDNSLKQTDKAVKSYVDNSLKQKAALGGASGQDFQTKSLSVSGDLHLIKDREILFADNGQIRSADDNHRILFRRSSNKMELREYGDITFSPGATAGKETAKVVMSGIGNVGIGAINPKAKLTIQQGGTVAGSVSEKKTFFVSGDINPGTNYDGGIEFRHDNLSQGIGFGYRAIYATGKNEDQPLHIYARGKSPLTINAFGGKGNVGIGTTKPETKLDVRGDVQIAGTAPVQYKIELRGSALQSKEGNETYLHIDDKAVRMTKKRGLNTVVLKPDGTFRKNATHDVYGSPAQWNNWADWVSANAKEGDVVAVATFDALRNAPGVGSAAGLLNSIGAEKAFKAVQKSARSPYALLFIKGGSRSIEVSQPHKGPNAHLVTTSQDLAKVAGLAKLDVRGVIRAETFEATNPNPLRHRMYPDNPIVYQEIFDAKTKKAIIKLGSPQYNDTSWKTKLWSDRHIIQFGSDNEVDDNGAQVNIPAGYDTVWVRVLGDRWTAIKAYFLDGGKENLGLWAGGYRSNNGYCPDGSLSDGYNDPKRKIKGGSTLRVDAHQWLPIPARRAGKLALVAKPHTNSSFWLSGLAFSKNPWAHAAQSAVVYHWKLNGGTDVKWNTHNWNQDVLAEIIRKNKYKLMVPVVPSGRDKLLYLINHNHNWNGCSHNGITVNGQPIERFIATYDNPFARHWNSKFYERYIAARIPAGLIPDNARWLSVQIDMSKQNQSIHFREIGTHDLDIPTDY